VAPAVADPVNATEVWAPEDAGVDLPTAIVVESTVSVQVIVVVPDAVTSPRAVTTNG
jgi:hypothetical protein